MCPEGLRSNGSGKAHAGVADVSYGTCPDEEIVPLNAATNGPDLDDAPISMESRRCGVTDVIGLDADMQRAQADFDIDAWR